MRLSSWLPAGSSPQVFLGLHDARDKRRATNRSVEKVMLHPEFQPRNYNNDIALVKLSEGVELNQVIRPVCLPPPQSKVSGKKATAAC